MKNGLIIGVAAALTLTGCAGGRIVLEGMGSSGSLVIAKPKPQNPVVFVDGTGSDAILVVDQEPIRIKVKEIGHTGTFEPVTIEFALATSGYTFAPENASDPLKMAKAKNTTTSPGAATCVFPAGDATKLSCTYTPMVKKATYSYTLRVQETSSGNFVSSDPSILND